VSYFKINIYELRFRYGLAGGNCDLATRLEVQEKLRLGQCNSQRIMDILISLILGLTLLPVFLINALLIHDRFAISYLRSGAPGQNGRKIRIYKFRSMYVNADKVLTDYLEKNPFAQQEWTL
jgi:lipopolysaccharide/colanic/teichoic acid biosynthesis glycosyltransferase